MKKKLTLVLMFVCGFAKIEAENIKIASLKLTIKNLLAAANKFRS